MKKRRDLTKGSIMKCLLAVALPTVGTAFVQMAYNLTDLFWLGKVESIGLNSTEVLAGVGTVGFYLWLGVSVIFLAKIGTEIRVAQSAGAKDDHAISAYATEGLRLVVVLSLIYGLLGFFGRDLFIGFFNFQNDNVIQYAKSYMGIISLFIVFYSMNPVFSGIYNGLGSSFLPFIVSSIGLVLNMILDPIFILVLGWGVEGAAIATVVAQLVVTITFIILFISKHRPTKIILTKDINLSRLKEILKLSIPAALQSALFTIFSIVIGVFVASFGYEASTTHKLGSQIEQIAWQIGSGFQVALSAFMGQNIGAKLYSRIRKGYHEASKILLIYGGVVVVLMFVFAKQLIGIFSDDPIVIEYGTIYLQIQSISQVFMLFDIASAGAFQGIGQTTKPSIVGITFNALRIPMAYLLMGVWGLNGIWITISATATLKGIILYIWYRITLTKIPKVDAIVMPTLQLSSE
ncbi:MAG TPA: MATE family efflux transporter [Bacilli bacterium]|nr:MATE family efflux transporter [Bacilli bacterium]